MDMDSATRHHQGLGTGPSSACGGGGAQGGLKVGFNNIAYSNHPQPSPYSPHSPAFFLSHFPPRSFPSIFSLSSLSSLASLPVFSTSCRWWIPSGTASTAAWRCPPRRSRGSTCRGPARRGRPGTTGASTVAWSSPPRPASPCLWHSALHCTAVVQGEVIFLVGSAAFLRKKIHTLRICMPSRYHKSLTIRARELKF